MANNRRNHDAYVTIRVLKGDAVLEGLYIGEQRIEDFVAAETTAPEPTQTPQ